jgi:hypothetical protein
LADSNLEDFIDEWKLLYWTIHTAAYVIVPKCF